MQPRRVVVVAGINKNKFCVFTTSSAVNNAVKGIGVAVVHLDKLAGVGREGAGDVGPKFRRYCHPPRPPWFCFLITLPSCRPSLRCVSLSLCRYFLQAWLAFAVSASGNKMLWQSPGTIWLERPDNLISAFPLVETLWSFKGRKDRRAAPFFSSFDFFAPSAAERPVHLMHEILLHFDLVRSRDPPSRPFSPSLLRGPPIDHHHPEH